MKSRGAWVSAAVLACAACAAAYDPSIDPTPQPLPVTKVEESVRPRSELLTAAELVKSGTQWTSEGVRRLRPEYVRPTMILNGNNEVVRVTPSVFLNGMYTGGLEVLDLIPLESVVEVRFYRPSRGYDVWGLSCRCSGGAIDIKTKHQH